jgi:hypothetical protein
MVAATLAAAEVTEDAGEAGGGVAVASSSS